MDAPRVPGGAGADDPGQTGPDLGAAGLPASVGPDLSTPVGASRCFNSRCMVFLGTYSYGHFIS